MQPYTYFITWNTYGAWLPGDARHWRKRSMGDKPPQPLLEAWCKEQMKQGVVLLSANDRETVEYACDQHCKHRDWALLAVNARTNHVHVVVVADAGPSSVRDQLKANCTRALRSQNVPLDVIKTWAIGGDVEILDTDDDIATVVQYVLEAQDRMDRRS